MPARVERRVAVLDLVGSVMAECGEAGWFVMHDENGKAHEHQYGAITTLDPQRQWARDLCAALNREVDFDGSWIVAWADPVMVEPPAGMGHQIIGIARPIPSRCVWFHMDKDGDVNFSVDTEDPLRDVLGSDINERVEHAAIAHQGFRDLVREVGIDTRHTRKAALGQAPTDPTLKVAPYIG